MNCSNHVKYLTHLLCLISIEGLHFFLVDNPDTTFKEANSFLVCYFTRLVHFVIGEKGEPRLLQATGLPSHNGNFDERIILVREEGRIIFKLILVELAIVQVGNVLFAISLFHLQNISIKSASVSCTSRLLTLDDRRI